MSQGNGTGGEPENSVNSRIEASAAIPNSPISVSRLLHSVKWTTAGTVVNVVAQFACVAAMGRLLDPGAFGVVAMTTIAIRFLSYFAQFGLGPALIQKLQVDKTDLSGALGIGIVLSGGLYLVLFLAAPGVALLIREPSAVWVIRAIGLTLVTTTLSPIPQALLRRRLRFKALAAIETFSFVIGYACVGIAMAWLGFGVWSIVAGTLCQSVLVLVAAWTLEPIALAPRLRGLALGHFWRFGSRYSAIGFLEFLTANVDPICIGTLGSTPLGLYNRAQMLTAMPVEMAVTSVTKVMHPALAGVQGERQKLANAYLVMLFFVLACVGAICGGMAVAAPDVVAVVLGPKWSALGPVVAAIAWSVPLAFVSAVTGTTFDACGLLEDKLVIQTLTLILRALAVVLTLRFGLAAVAWAVVGTEAVRASAGVWAVSGRLGLDRAVLAKVIAIAVGATASVVATMFAGTQLIEAGFSNVFVRFPLEVFCGGVALTCALVGSFRGLRSLDAFEQYMPRLPVIRFLYAAGSRAGRPIVG